MKNTCVVLMLVFPLLAHADDKGREFYVAVGRFSPASNAQLGDPSGQYGLALGGGGRFSPHFSWNVDLLFADARVDTPKAFVPGFLISQSGRADLETWGFGGILKAHLPLGIFDLHAGGGVGFYKSTLTVKRGVVFLPFVADQEIKRSDRGLGVQWIAGADARLGDSWRLGFQWRRLDFKAQLGAEVPGEVNTGGNLGLLYSRWTF